ncbi:alpha/beta fold hydrolase [Ornithinimicrobium cerasi]|uniref:alpha/beta fold hydrolase n=1 Tax=Ornithinimicrobium cerasi TaxID=2248773 RepID=UPI001F1603DC|nr:alpha/beta hydrolase [Ornithinimicrobium cerasi]
MTDSAPPPRLVLVHGTRMSAAQWDPYPALLPGAEVVAVDLPGHGSRVAEPFTVEAALGVLDAAVSGRTPGQGVVLAGHSLGGYLAALYAQAHPDRLSALVLLGASADPSHRLAVVYRGFAALLPRVGAARMARFTNAVVRRLGVSGAAADSLPDGAAYAALPAAWAAVMGACGPHLLREVGCPVVLVNGQWDQMRLHVRRYAAACADPHIVTVPRATHFAPLTHPDEVAAALRTALRLAAQGRPSRAAYHGARDLDPRHPPERRQHARPRDR